jgi:transposase
MPIRATTTRAADSYCAAETSPRRIARRGVESTTRLGRHRWKVERSLAWLLANRRLTIRYERRADLLTAFLHLACALLCARRLRPR